MVRQRALDGDHELKVKPDKYDVMPAICSVGNPNDIASLHLRLHRGRVFGGWTAGRHAGTGVVASESSEVVEADKTVGGKSAEDRTNAKGRSASLSQHIT